MSRRAKSERVGAPKSKSEFFRELPETWKPKGVADFLARLAPSFEQYRAEIMKQAINGDSMKVILTNDELLRERIGVDSLIHRHVISQSVNALFQDNDLHGDSPLLWSREQVADFVANIAPVYKKYRDMIVENGVNGHAMAVVLQEDEYLNILGLNFSIHRKVIAANVRKLFMHSPGRSFFGS